MDFHVVILTTTAIAFCRYCRPREIYFKTRDAWSYLRELDAVRLAFPQDDYHQSNDIDALFKEWGIEVIYTVLPDHVDMFYPLSSQSAQVKGVLTGYVDDNSILSVEPLSRPFDDRKFDLVQRVKMHPFFGGNFSQIKGRMADRFLEISKNRSSLTVNISTSPNDVLTGNRWLELLGNGRFALGSEGGVSLWDPDGVYFDRERKYLEQYPDASFEDVEGACFPGEDGRYTFSTISPRLFESAMMGCSQILVEGEYLGLLQPWDHFIPVRHDLQDVDDALEATKDVSAAKRRVGSCYDTLIDCPSLRYTSLVTEVIEDIHRLALGRAFDETLPQRFKESVAAHRLELARTPSVMVLRAWTRIPPRLRCLVPPSIRKVAHKVLT